MKKTKENDVKKKGSGTGTRLVFGLLLAAFAIFVLFNVNTILFDIAVIVLTTMAVFEVLHAVQIKNKILVVVGTLTAPLVSLYMLYRPELPLFPIAIVYIMALLVIMLIKYDETRFEHVAMTVFVSLCIPAAFGCIALLRDLGKVYPGFTEYECMFLILTSIYCSEFTDTCAYFAGRAFGKHKLCPKISPKKTVEGAIGGILGTVILTLCTLAVYNHFFFTEKIFTYWGAALVAAVVSVISMLGDLSASTIKRNYGIKDFGKIMPGHGGIMDRIDSLLFAVPAMYVFVTLAQNI